MLIAQGLGEYGVLSGSGNAAVNSVLANVDDAIQNAEPSTWMALSLGGLVLWFLFLRKR